MGDVKTIVGQPTILTLVSIPLIIKTYIGYIGIKPSVTLLQRSASFTLQLFFESYR